AGQLGHIGIAVAPVDRGDGVGQEPQLITHRHADPLPPQVQAQNPHTLAPPSQTIERGEMCPAHLAAISNRATYGWLPSGLCTLIRAGSSGTRSWVRFSRPETPDVTLMSLIYLPRKGSVSTAARASATDLPRTSSLICA